MEEGVVVRLKKDTAPDGKARGYGFIEREGKSDLHFGITPQTPKIWGVEDGDKVKFEEGTSSDGRATAKKVEIVARADGSPYVPGKKGTTQGVQIIWHFDPVTTGVTAAGLEYILPLTITVSSEGKPVNAQLTLKADGAEVMLPSPNPSTDGRGKAEFSVPVAKNARSCSLALTVVEGGNTKIYNHIWDRRNPNPQKETPSASSTPSETPAHIDKKKPAIEILKQPRDADPSTGLFFVALVTRKDGKQVNRKFTYASTPVPVEIKQMTDKGLVTVTAQTIKPMGPTAGMYQLYIGFTPEVRQVKITFQLEDGNETVLYLRR